MVVYFNRPPQTYSSDSNGDELDKKCQIIGARNSQTVVETAPIVTPAASIVLEAATKPSTSVNAISVDEEPTTHASSDANFRK